MIRKAFASPIPFLDPNNINPLSMSQNPSLHIRGLLLHHLDPFLVGPQGGDIVGAEVLFRGKETLLPGTDLKSMAVGISRWRKVRSHGPSSLGVGLFAAISGGLSGASPMGHRFVPEERKGSSGRGEGKLLPRDRGNGGNSARGKGALRPPFPHSISGPGWPVPLRALPPPPIRGPRARRSSRRPSRRPPSRR